MQREKLEIDNLNLFVISIENPRLFSAEPKCPLFIVLIQ